MPSDGTCQKTNRNFCSTHVHTAGQDPFRLTPLNSAPDQVISITTCTLMVIHRRVFYYQHNKESQTMNDYRYPWPASAIGRSDMELLHAVRESTSPRVPITRLIAAAVASTYGQDLKARALQQQTSERKSL
jgi:subtilase family serine protease